MIINKKSWHYKLMSIYFQYEDPKNLCQYIRYVIYSILLSIMFFVVSAGITITVLVSLISVIKFIFTGSGYGEKYTVIGAVLLTTVPLFFIIKYLTNYLSNKFKNKPVKVKKPNIYIEMIKDYHNNKICKMIRYTSDE